MPRPCTIGLDFAQIEGLKFTLRYKCFLAHLKKSIWEEVHAGHQPHDFAVASARNRRRYRYRTGDQPGRTGLCGSLRISHHQRAASTRTFTQERSYFQFSRWD